MSKENTKGLFNENDTADEDDPYYITLTLDDGAVMECMVVGFFEALNRDYIALLPTEGKMYEDGEVYLYRYSELPATETEHEQPILDVIESDEEYEAVADAFHKFLESLDDDL